MTLKNASEIESYLESKGLRASSIKVHLGRWVDMISIIPAKGESPSRLKRILAKLEEFIDAEGIVHNNRNNDIIMMEIPKYFIPISYREIVSDGDGLCLGLTWDDKPLMIDIRSGGLLIVGDPGTGKTILMEQCRERLYGQFEIIDADNDILREFSDISMRKERLESETILLADNFERLSENSQRDLLYIALKGHLIGIYVIVSTSDLNTVTPLLQCLFKNIVLLRISESTKARSYSQPHANNLRAYGDGIFRNIIFQTRFHTTNFNKMKTHQKEDALFVEWMEHLKKVEPELDVESLFCPDGLHYTGKPVKRDGEHYVIDRDYKEEQLWENSNRVVFLSKDHNLKSDEEGVDVRDESGLDNGNGHIEPHFFQRFLLLNYGLGKLDLKSGEFPNYIEASDECLDYFHSCAVVRMNVKKVAGGSECSQTTLKTYIDIDEDFIRRQLDLYRGKIIVCLDGSEKSQIMKFLRTVYPDIERYDTGEEYNFIHYSESTRTVLIHEWHPSYAIGYELYYSAVRQLSMFIKSHPGFFDK